MTTAVDRDHRFRLGVGGQSVSRAYIRRRIGSSAALRNDRPWVNLFGYVHRNFLSFYLISLLVTVAGSAAQFSRITSV